MTLPMDPAAEALEEMAVAAERAAVEERAIARRARALSRHRQRGASSVELVKAGAVSTIVDAIRVSTREVLTAARTVQAALVRSMAQEGHTTRQIGEHLGVSHQHVSALRRRTRGTHPS